MILIVLRDRASLYYNLPNSTRAPPPDSNNRLNLRFTARGNRAFLLTSSQTRLRSIGGSLIAPSLSPLLVQAKI